MSGIFLIRSTYRALDSAHVIRHETERKREAGERNGEREKERVREEERERVERGRE